MAQEAYTIKLPVFEGPMDLLLTLIRDNKIDIYNIPIAFITNQYLEYIRLMKELNLEVAGEFLVMAATLIHIKSRMLLPAEERDELTDEEDPRMELVERLLEYRSFRDSALFLREQQEEWEDVFTREPSWVEEDGVGEPGLFNVALYDLLKAFREILSRAPVEVTRISKEVLTIKDKIAIIIERLSTVKELFFEDLFTVRTARIEVITTFVALLEVVKLGIAGIYQKEDFGRILIKLAGSGRKRPESAEIE